MNPPPAPPAPGLLRRWRCCVLPGVGLVLCLCASLLVAVVINRVLPPADETTLRNDLNTRLEETRSVWQSLSELWGRLEAGEAIRCGDVAVTRPYFLAWRDAERAAYPALAELADRLNAAISNLHAAADAWTAACQSGQTGIAPGTAAGAHAALERAADALDAVSQASGF